MSEVASFPSVLHHHGRDTSKVWNNCKGYSLETKALKNCDGNTLEAYRLLVNSEDHTLKAYQLLVLIVQLTIISIQLSSANEENLELVKFLDNVRCHEVGFKTRYAKIDHDQFKDKMRRIRNVSRCFRITE